ncbi:MAG: hypothetical protein Q4G09_07025 [Clostridia bacterium]|nr:hypothetical protein [Clostridia bacterium]
MSYEKCKMISIKPKSNQIFITIAPNNVIPLSYGRCEYAPKEHCSLEDKLMYLMISMLDGNIQISQLNNSTIPFEYALIKVREHFRENDINEYGSKYDKIHKLYDEELSKYVDINNWEECNKFCKENKELINKIERKINKDLYKREFEIFKKSIYEQTNDKYYLKDKYGRVIEFVRETSRGYSFRTYAEPNNDCIIDYKLACIRKEQMGKDYEIIKYEKVQESNRNEVKEEDEYEEDIF